MSDELTPLRLAQLRIAVLTALSNQAAADLEAAREDAKPLFARAFNTDGLAQIRPVLPGQKPGLLGTITVKAGDTTITVDPGRLRAWADLHPAAAYHDYVAPSCLTRPDVIEHIAAKFPDLVERGRMRDSWRQNQVKIALAHDGVVIDNEDQSMRIADVETAQSEGRIIYNPGKKATAAVAEAWRNRLIPPEIDLGILALPAPAPSPEEPIEGVIVTPLKGEQLAEYIDGWAADLGHPVSDDAHGGWSRNPEDGRVVCHCNGPGAELIPSNAGWTGKAAA